MDFLPPVRAAPPLADWNAVLCSPSGLLGCAPSLASRLSATVLAFVLAAAGKRSGALFCCGPVAVVAMAVEERTAVAAAGEACQQNIIG